ncbi:hypothetical protein EW026_g7600 [Hermanssonia centrifuga]|uniref:Flavin-containing monooxygenase n=1 Tax=Hermanssonia centrifuga TaxID=98765 RepID=A0A4S4K7A3_9APHY|nr:hypothetical protein EW026_g7600 [Hermanssonia centrifuga]
MSVPDEQTRIAAEWLTDLASALQSANAEAFAATFLPDGWFRDVLTFTWDNHTLEGRDKIVSYVSKNISPAEISQVKLSDDSYFRPTYVPSSPGPDQGVETGFTFETSIAHGKGYARLVRNEHGEWKALLTSMMLVDIKGHEELPGRENFEDIAANRSWGEMEAERKGLIESDPYVIIIGSGQTGVQVAARFKQMNIPTLVLERNKRVGDNWRHRYDSLALHTVREHHQLLYQPHPSTWPIFTPRDKVASMLESYAVNQDLVVWTSSAIVGRPVYNSETRTWDVAIDHAGAQVRLHPAHIVLATGTSGDPYIPKLEDKGRFTGTSIHATQYKAPQPFSGQDVVVVGAGNTAIDICQDLATCGAKSVTMVQRSSTCVISRDSTVRNLSATWPQGVPVEVGDFKIASFPLGYLRKMAIQHQDKAWAQEKELHDKLKKGGVKVHLGSEGQGPHLLVFERGGGYWLDKGAADLIASGEIKVKQGFEPKAFTETGILLTDGSVLPATL